MILLEKRENNKWEGFRKISLGEYVAESYEIPFVLLVYVLWYLY